MGWPGEACILQKKKVVTFGEGEAGERKKLFPLPPNFSNKGDKARVTSKHDLAT